MVNEREAARLLSELSARSKSLEDESWYTHWRTFALSQSRYCIVSPEHYEDLAHYLDCESHTDVCREIYQTMNQSNKLE